MRVSNAEISPNPLKIVRRLQTSLILVLILAIAVYPFHSNLSLAFFVVSGFMMIVTIIIQIKIRSHDETLNLKSMFGTIFIVLGLLLLGTSINLVLKKDFFSSGINILGGIYSVSLGMYHLKQQNSTPP